MSAIEQPYQVLSDCPHCHTESAVLELMDPAVDACHFGLPASPRCRLCAFETKVDSQAAPQHAIADRLCPACTEPLFSQDQPPPKACPHCAFCPTLRVLQQPQDLTDRAVASAALKRWAQEEHEENVERFCATYMDGDLAYTLQCLQQGERLKTSFDLIAHLFSDTNIGGMGASPNREQETVSPEPLASSLTPQLHPLTAARFLTSIMIADGRITKRERDFVQRVLDKEGLAQPAADETRLWRSHELCPGPTLETARRLLRCAVELTFLDGDPDKSQDKILRAVGHLWGVSDDELLKWKHHYANKHQSFLQRLYAGLTERVKTH